ncbi:MAG: segregation and condensation protein A [Candidatus Aminicenantaceae bacterium]
METSANYQVKLDVFQGPMDLLLFLIKKKKLNIHDIPIAVITRDYLSYLEKKEMINLDREAEFLLIASLLIYIKSQMLLPQEKFPEKDEEDPRQVLVDRLLDYQKIKAACQDLKQKEEIQIKKWTRTFLPPVLDEEPESLEVSLFDIAYTFFSLMKRKERENLRIVKGKDITIEEKMKELISYLKKNEFLDFGDYFSKQETLEEALISFFSLLELIKVKAIIAVQESTLQPIKVWLRKIG